MNKNLKIGDKVEIIHDENKAKSGEVGTLRSLNASRSGKRTIITNIGNKCWVECERPPYNFHGKLSKQIVHRLVNQNNLKKLLEFKNG